MRKYVSILLLLVLLFNIVGYRALFYYAEQKADFALETQLDDNLYNEQDLISINIPLDNPYLADEKGFERVNGELTFQGTTYKYVKRRVTKGNLVLYCIPNTQKMVLKKAGYDYGNSVNDLAGTNKNSSRSGIQKNINANDYENHSDQYQLPLLGISLPARVTYLQISIKEPLMSAPGKPPQFFA